MTGCDPVYLILMFMSSHTFLLLLLGIFPPINVFKNGVRPVRPWAGTSSALLGMDMVS